MSSLGEPRQAFVGAGANLGDRETTLRRATDRLARFPGIVDLATSAVYETEPVGVTDQPEFFNLVIGLSTTLAPEALLAALLALEREHGRERRVRWGPRTLDLDLLAYQDYTCATAELELPHPRMLERAFVVTPLLELLARPAFHRPCWTALEQALRRARPGGQILRRVREPFS